MTQNYKVIIKRLIVFLTILLIVVCLSFSVSYSNFIYKVPSHRAVELLINKLSYSIIEDDKNISTLLVHPGNNVYNIKIKSNNEIESLYKLLVSDIDNIEYYYLDGKTYGNILSNEVVNIKLLIVNKSNNDLNVNLVVNGGYLNNTIEDVYENEEYKIISKKINIGSEVIYRVNNNYTLKKEYSNLEEDTIINSSNTGFKLLNINDDGSIELISSSPVSFGSTNVCFSGYNGYNNYVNVLNEISKSLYTTSDSVLVRNVNINDIEKYINKRLLSSLKTENVNNNMVLPGIFRYEKGVLINNMTESTNLDKSDEFIGTLSNDYEIASSISFMTYYLNTLTKDDFNNEEYYNLLLNDMNYYLSTRYSNIESNIINFSALSIDNNLTINNIYNSSNQSNIVCTHIRPIIKLSNKYYLKLKEE